MISFSFLLNSQITEKATEMAGRHMPHIRFWGTNWWDTHIVLIICVTIVIVIFILAVAALCWQKKKLNALTSKKDVDKNKDDLQKKDEELKKVTEELNKLKATQANKNYSLFKDLCNMSRDKEGIVDPKTADSLYVLYQKINKDNPSS